MFARSNLRRPLVLLSLVSALFAAALVVTPGCSPSTDDRLVGKWTGTATGSSKTTYTFRKDGNLDVQMSAADTLYPSKWSVLSWEGDVLTIRMLNYQQEWVVRKVKMIGTDEFEMADEADAPIGKFKRDAS